MLHYTTAQSTQDLTGILALQQANLAANLSIEEMESQGFVTVQHSLDSIKKMNDVQPHVIAKEENRVVGYLLSMTPAAKADVPILLPMFELFERLDYKGKPIATYSYLVVGQACIAKEYRGQGLLRRCYLTYKEIGQAAYDFAITEIATRNSRSLAAHRRVGFTEISCYTDPAGEEWSVMLWPW